MFSSTQVNNSEEASNNSNRTHDMDTPIGLCSATLPSACGFYFTAAVKKSKCMTLRREFYLPLDLCLHSSVLWFGSRKVQRLLSCGWKHRPFTSFTLKQVAKIWNKKSIAIAHNLPVEVTARAVGCSAATAGADWTGLGGGGPSTARPLPGHSWGRPALPRPAIVCKGKPRVPKLQKGLGLQFSVNHWRALVTVLLVKNNITRTNLQPFCTPTTLWMCSSLTWASTSVSATRVLV